MTTAHRDDLADEFRAHLPAWAAHALWPTGKVAHLVSVAVSRGWTSERLAAEATAGLERHYRPGGVITARLERFSQQPPPASATQPAARPFCSPECEQRRGWIEDDRGRPIEKCHCRSTS